MNFLIEPFQYPFIQRAMTASVIIGVLCACVGTFVVLRRMSLVGHALTHSALPGLVIAYLLRGSIFLGAFIATLSTAIFIGLLSKDEEVYEDTSVGMIPTVMFALGVILISNAKSYRDMSSLLFGNILGVTNQDLVLIGLIAAVVIFCLWCFFKELKLFCVDPHYARIIGIPVDLIRYGLLVLLSLVVVVGIQAVGTILTNALLVIPVATARLLTDRLLKMMVIASLCSALASLSGVYVSYYLGFSSGASIVMSSALIFFLVWCWDKAKRP